MPNSQGKARHLWCGWSEWLRMVGKNQEPGPSLWLSNRCFIQIYHNIFDWLKRSSAPMKTCWNMLKPVETANMCISSINTQSIYKQSLKNNNCARVANERKRPCASESGTFEALRQLWVWDVWEKVRPVFHPRPTVCSFPWVRLGIRAQAGVHLVPTSVHPSVQSCDELAAKPGTHPLGTSWNILEHLGTSWNWTSDPFWVLRSPGVEPCLKVSAQCIKRRSHRML